MSRPPERSLLFLFLLILLACFQSGAAEGALPLFSGDQNLGSVSSTKQGAHLLVSVADMASFLEFPTATKGDTFIVTAGRNRMQLVAGAAAAWLDVELVPLAASCIQQNGQWLLESESALKLFNSLLLRSGKSASLRWGSEGSGGVTVPVSPSAPKKPPSSPVPETPIVSGPSSARPLLKGIRWGIDDEKIRIVMDFEGAGEPEVQRGAGSVKVFFSSGSWPVPGVPSPCREVSVGSMNFGDRLLLDFTSALAVHEILSLDGPQRLVIDYGKSASPGVSSPYPPSTVEVLRPSPTPSPSPKPPSTDVMPRPPTRAGRRIVVVDAGHGGKDPGAVANKLREKDLNLAVSRILAARLKELGIDARLTRNSDVYLTLRQRTEIANTMNADVFISIHVNALPPGRSATGMEIYLMALPTDKDAMELARFENRELAEDNGDSHKAADKRTQTLLAILGNMQQNAKISESTGFAEFLFNCGKAGSLKMRRVAQAPFYVLRGAAMPALLIELGFLTDKQEAKLLADSAYQRKMANALAQGIQEYLKNN